MKEVSMKTADGKECNLNDRNERPSARVCLRQTRRKMLFVLMAYRFCKGVFLPVDASIWINNIFKGKNSDVC